MGGGGGVIFVGGDILFEYYNFVVNGVRFIIGMWECNIWEVIWNFNYV